MMEDPIVKYCKWLAAFYPPSILRFLSKLILFPRIPQICRFWRRLMLWWVMMGVIPLDEKPWTRWSNWWRTRDVADLRSKSLYGFVWKCWVYSQWNSHSIGIMISKTTGFRGTQHFQTHPYSLSCQRLQKLEAQVIFWVTPNFHWLLRTTGRTWWWFWQAIAQRWHAWALPKLYVCFLWEFVVYTVILYIYT